MANFRVVPTTIWADDNFLSASPEQKLVAIYLYTNAYATQCGIYKVALKTMGFQLGFTQSPAESALKGLCAALPDFFAYDQETGEVAILQHPTNVLCNASSKIIRQAVEELKKVQSKTLLQEVIKRNSATMSAMYLSRLRAIQATELNSKDVNTIPYIDIVQYIEEEQVKGEIEIEREIEKKVNEIDARKVDFSNADTIINAADIALTAFIEYMNANDHFYPSGITKREFEAAARGHFNKLQREGQFYHLTVPTGDKLYSWVAQRLAGVKSYHSASKSFDARAPKQAPQHQQPAPYSPPAAQAEAVIGANTDLL